MMPLPVSSPVSTRQSNAPQRSSSDLPRPQAPERPSSAASTTSLTSRSSLSSLGRSQIPFPRTLLPLQLPAPSTESSWLFRARLGAMLIAGVTMLRPGYTLCEDAPEHPLRMPRQSTAEVEELERLIRMDIGMVRAAPIDSVPMGESEADYVFHSGWDAWFSSAAPLRAYERHLRVRLGLISSPRPAPSPELYDRRAHLRGGFDLIFGSGFGGWLPFLGVLRALEREGLMAMCTGLYGVSAGALTLALYRCLGVERAGDVLLNFGAKRFLADLSLQQAWREGSITKGEALYQGIAEALRFSPYQRIEQISRPKLRLGIFDGKRGRGVWPRQGSIAQTVAYSLALPGLYPQRGYCDGGWVDHHATRAQKRNVVSLSVRLPTKLERTFEQRWVGRPEPLFNVSLEPEHLQMQLVTTERVNLISMLYDLDSNKPKLKRIVDEAEVQTLWYLRQPFEPIVAARKQKSLPAGDA